MLDPLGRAASWYAVYITLLDLTYTAFLVPLSIAFLPTNWRSLGDFSFLAITGLISSKLSLTSCRAYC